MPVTANDDLTEVYELLRRPSQEALPWQDALKSLARQYTFRAKQFQLSDKNWFLQPKPLTPGAMTEALNVDDYSLPVKITMRNRSAQPDDLWLPVDIVNADEIEYARMDGRNAVAIYGNPPMISYTMDITDLAFTLWYEPSATRPTKLTDTPQIETDFNTLLVYNTVLECGGMIRDDSDEYMRWWKDREGYFVAQVTRWEAVMIKWMSLSRGQGRVYKRGWPRRTGNPYNSTQDEFKRR